jgi:hypothetical protein
LTLKEFSSQNFYLPSGFLLSLNASNEVCFQALIFLLLASGFFYY